MGNDLSSNSTFDENMKSQSQMNKKMEAQSIDLARIMVADLSAHETIEAFWGSEDYREFMDDFNEWEGDLTKWSEWERLIGDHFEIISNQNLRIEDNRVRGTVPGVQGLNYFFVALLEDNVIQYDCFGDPDALAMGVEGETKEVAINMQRRVPQGDFYVRITYPQSGAQISQRTVTISGTVSDVEVTQAMLYVNDESQSIAVNNGYFANVVVLLRGTNTIRVEAVDTQQRIASDQVTILCDIPAVDIRVTLTWNTSGTDLDLYVTDPNQETVYYSHKNSAIGGQLDVDDTNGYGPENFTLDDGEAIQGEYTVYVRHYGGNLPSTATVVILLHEDDANESVTTYGPHEFQDYSETWIVATIVWP
jgi:uncharacterized protein YfaP (DUF2135 family)